MKKYKVIFEVVKIIECNSAREAVNKARLAVGRSDFDDYNFYELTEKDLKDPENIRIMEH